jgi:hypothetical protein
MQVLKKRICSFRPDSSVRAMLAEVDALITALELDVTLQDVINASLRQYLPSLIMTLRQTAASRDELLRQKTLREAEAVIRGEKI